MELQVLSNTQYDHVLTDLLDDDFNNVLWILIMKMSKVDNFVQMLA